MPEQRILATVQTEVQTATDFLLKRGIENVIVGIILGTGLHHLGTLIESEIAIPYHEIPGFCRSTVESHSGILVYGRLGNKTVIALKGRFHLYEGYSLSQVTFPVKVLHKLGVKQLFISNAAGSLNPAFRKGELMRLTSHLDFQQQNGGQYSMDVYDENTGTLMEQIAAKANISLHKGCYAAVSGPQLETRAEYRLLRNLGADAVGMSTVPEAEEAGRLKINCTAVSVLTDECDPDNLHPVTLDEIIAVAGASDKILTSLFYQTIQEC